MRLLNFSIILYSSVLLILLGNVQQASSQIKNGSVWPDKNGKHINAHGGSITCYEGTYYWYGEHKIEDFSKIKCSFIGQIPQQDYIGGLAEAGIHCFSSTDLESWNDEGIVLPVNYENEEDPMAYASIVERPKVLYNAGLKQFVMHFKLKSKQKNELFAKHGSPMYYGVAISNSPTGPFRYSHKYLAGFSEEGAGDHTLFIDDDGTAYLFFAAKPGHIMYFSRLSSDFLNPAGKFMPCEGIAPRFEAPAIFKANGIYHLLGSGTKGWDPTPPKYAISNSVEGPWIEIQPNDGILKSSEVNQITKMGAEITFGGQCTFVLKLANKTNAFLVMYDQWDPIIQYKSTYFWLPVEFDKKINPYVRWHDQFDLK